MRRWMVGCVLLACMVSLWPLARTQADSPAFRENFSTTTYRDASNTTAHWDTTSGLLKLGITTPISTQQMGARYAPSACASFSMPAVYVPETGKAYQFSTQILEYDPQGNVALPISFSGATPHCNSAAAAYASAVGKIYLFGGCDIGEWGSCTPLRDIYEFDPMARTNTRLSAAFPYGIKGAVAAYVPRVNKIYVFGGETPDGLLVDIWEFDVTTRSLAKLAIGLPSARRDACCAYVSETDHIYLLGGRAQFTTLDDILTFDPTSRQLMSMTTRLPVGLQAATAAYVPTAARVFVIGGEKSVGGTSFNVYAFAPTTGEIAATTYTLPGDGLVNAAAIYVPQGQWLAILGGRTFGFWPSWYAGILRFRWSGSDLVAQDSHLFNAGYTYSAVYVPDSNQAYLFGGDRAEVLRFDVNTSQVFTMSATLPMTCTDPGVVWVSERQQVYVFSRLGIYAYSPRSDSLSAMSARLPADFDPRVVAYAPPRNAIYLFDSANGAGAILRYDLATDRLTTLGARLPSPRCGAYATYVPASNQISLLGGRLFAEDQAYTDELLAFDVASETLTRLERRAPMPGEYKAAVLLPTTQQITLLGGWGGYSEAYSWSFAQIWRYETTPGARRFITETLTLAETLGRQAVVWDATDDRIYTFGGLGKSGPLTRYTANRIYRFDLAHVAQGQAQSTRINDSSSNVLRATLSVAQQSNQGTIHYYLSNTGGTNWEAVTPETEHVFAHTGNDLRWRAVLTGDGIYTPAIDELTVEWATQVSTPTYTTTPTTTMTPTYTATLTNTSTATRTVTPSDTVTPTSTPTATPSPTGSISPSPTSSGPDHYVYLPLITIH